MHYQSLYERIDEGIVVHALTSDVAHSLDGESLLREVQLSQHELRRKDVLLHHQGMSRVQRKQEKEKEKVESEASKAQATGDSDELRVKMVKSMKNQFAINRLLLMFLDIQPEELTAETVENLKIVYALLIHIHSVYTTIM